VTLKALVVDDDQGIRNVMARTFRLDFGFEVQTAENPKEALDFLEANPTWIPVVILSDHDMPEMSGTDFYLHLREHRGLLEPRFILMSGSTKGRHIVETYSLPFLSKPFSNEALKQAVRNVLPTLTLDGVNGACQEANIISADANVIKVALRDQVPLTFRTRDGTPVSQEVGWTIRKSDLFHFRPDPKVSTTG
jgi:two-component system, chemotaxis family, chemotaxis protein CheY